MVHSPFFQGKIGIFESQTSPPPLSDGFGKWLRRLRTQLVHQPVLHFVPWPRCAELQFKNLSLFLLLIDGKSCLIYINNRNFLTDLLKLLGRVWSPININKQFDIHEETSRAQERLGKRLEDGGPQEDRHNLAGAVIHVTCLTIFEWKNTTFIGSSSFLLVFLWEVPHSQTHRAGFWAPSFGFWMMDVGDDPNNKSKM